jgi:hypothetical protein
MQVTKKQQAFISCGLVMGGLLAVLVATSNDATTVDHLALVDSPVSRVEVPAAAAQALADTQLVAEVDTAIADAEFLLANEAEASLPTAAVATDLGAADDLMGSDSPWQVAQADSTSVPSIPLDSAIKSYAVIKLDRRPTNFPSAGAKVTLPMFDGHAITANVESIKTMVNGDRVWTGHIDGMGDDFSVVMTYGEKLTFATINTPDGNYSLEAKDGLGWLYKNPSIVDLFGPDSVDSLVPETI